MHKWLTEELYTDSCAYFSAIEKDIQTARHSIEVESYIFDLSERALKLAKLLIDASVRGVQVRILVDGFGTAPNCASLEAFFAKTSVELRIFHPLFTVGILRLLRTFNRRNHRKSWIFDGQIAYVCSANIQTNAWIELGLRVSGVETKALYEAFLKAWAKKSTSLRSLASGLLRSQKANELILLNDTLFLRKHTSQHFNRRITEAKKTAWILNAYFSPRITFIGSLLKAKQRGVDICLIVPSVSDVFFMPWITRTYYSLLLAGGIRIFEYPGEFLHAKACIIDEWMTVGSTNINHRSLLHDLEVDLVVTDPRNQSRLRKKFEELMQASTKKTLAEVDARTILDRFFFWILTHVRKWL